MKIKDKNVYITDYQVNGNFAITLRGFCGQFLSSWSQFLDVIFAQKTCTNSI